MGCFEPSRCSTQPWFLRWLRSWRRFTASALPCGPVVFELVGEIHGQDVAGHLCCSLPTSRIFFGGMPYRGRLDLDVLPVYILALEILLRVLSPGFEHRVDGILEVLPRFFMRAALGDRAGDLRARGDDPAVFSVLVDRGKSLHALKSLLALVRPDLRALPQALSPVFVW